MSRRNIKADLAPPNKSICGKLEQIGKTKNDEIDGGASTV